jgi:hypothetical protein
MAGFKKGFSAPPVGPTPEELALQEQAAAAFGALSGGNLFETAGQMAEQQRAAADPTYGMSPEQLATFQQNAARDTRFGNDMAWLDPAFQQQAALLGLSAGSQAQSDPMAQVAQYGAMNSAAGLANSPLQFQGSGAQQALSNQWAGVQAGQGAPQFMGGAQQDAMMRQLLGVQAPQFSGDADQRAVMNQAMAFGSNTGPNSLTFDTSGRQGEQYGNLQGIIAGGGADTMERAARQAQRADQESWLRGQREADMSDYAERGLTGSGMELLALSGDRQAAAGRNSLADLQTAAALEERRLGAINSAAGLASNMRGQTTDEQSLLNQRATTGLGAASSVANAMRGANIQEQTFLNESAREQALQAAGIASTSRGQGMQEQSYLDQRMLNALSQQTDLQTQMRNQQYQEQMGGREATQSALGLQAQIANQARTSSAQEDQFRAGSADQFSVLNQAAVNAATGANTSFRQNAYQQAMNNRTTVGINDANRNASAASTLFGGDVADNAAAARQAYQTGATTSDQFNGAQANYNAGLTGMATDANNQALQAQAARNAQQAEALRTGGNAVGSFAMFGLGASGGGAGAAGGAAGAAGGAAAAGGGSAYNLGNFASQLNLGGAGASAGTPQNTGAVGGFNLGNYSEQLRRGSY